MESKRCKKENQKVKAGKTKTGISVSTVEKYIRQNKKVGDMTKR